MKITVSYFGKCLPGLDEEIGNLLKYRLLSTGYSMPDERRDLIFEKIEDVGGKCGNFYPSDKSEFDQPSDTEEKDDMEKKSGLLKDSLNYP